MTVPPDRRVWQQALALRSDGWRVSVLSPQMGAWRKPFEVINGVEIHRHPLPHIARGLAGYALEYGAALAFEAAGLLRMGLDDIDVVQICNPPDFLFAPALLAKRAGAKVVFDHHDLTPELLVQKFGDGAAAKTLLPVARWAQRRTFHIADQVISTNNAFRDVAIKDGGKAPDKVSVVYSGPDLDRLAPAAPDPQLRRGKKHLVLWVGVMGSQDGLDRLLLAAKALAGMPGGEDFQMLVAGDGPERPQAERMARELGVGDTVDFAGFLGGERLASAFASADIGVASDPKNAFNDRLAMNKVMEYMAYSLPIAMYDLAECRRIAGDAAIYAGEGDPRALAAAMSNLLSSPTVRASKGAIGRKRLEAEFSWERQKAAYLNVYRQYHPDF